MIFWYVANNCTHDVSIHTWQQAVCISKTRAAGNSVYALRRGKAKKQLKLAASHLEV